jgi:hypothetical protein
MDASIGADDFFRFKSLQLATSTESFPPSNTPCNLPHSVADSHSALPVARRKRKVHGNCPVPDTPATRLSNALRSMALSTSFRKPKALITDAVQCAPMSPPKPKRVHLDRPSPFPSPSHFFTFSEEHMKLSSKNPLRRQSEPAGF